MYCRRPYGMDANWRRNPKNARNMITMPFFYLNVVHTTFAELNNLTQLLSPIFITPQSLYTRVQPYHNIRSLQQHRFLATQVIYSYTYDLYHSTRIFLSRLHWVYLLTFNGTGLASGYVLTYTYTRLEYMHD